jgi:cbb3-type cytochrome oxidase subunit 3
VEFVIAGAVIIILLAVLGIVFLPRRREVLEQEQMLPLYPDRGERDRVRVLPRDDRSGGARNASRSGEGVGELREDRQVGVERDPLYPPDP